MRLHGYKDFKPTKMPDTKKPLIVLRQIETKAAYAKGKQDNHKTVAEKLAELGNVHIVGRYNEGTEEFGEKAVFEDTASLVANADLVVSYGGTISREAALRESQASPSPTWQKPPSTLTSPKKIFRSS